MPCKTKLMSRLSCWLLFVLAVSVLYVNGTWANTDSKMSSFNFVPSNRITGVNRGGKRRLRRGISTAADEDRVNVSSQWKLALTKLGIQSKTDELFSKFKVGKVTSNLLDSNEFVRWFVALEMSYKDNPGKAKMEIMSSLKARYGDRTLARWLATAEEANFIRDMNKIQLNNWQQDGKTVKSVYKLLKLDKEGDKLFESPLLATWIAYATKLDNENPYAAVFSTLNGRYDGNTFANILLAAKDNDNMVPIAEKLEILLLKSWQREDKSVVDVYKLLNLDNEGDKFFKNPLVDTLIKYATVTDKKNSFDGVFSMLQVRYNDEALTDMRFAMSWYPRTLLTDQLEELLLKNWHRDGKTIEDVFKLLKLDKDGDTLFNNPLISAWVSYVAKVDDKDPYGVVFSTLRKDYDETRLASMLVDARYMISTEKLAEELEKIQLSVWAKANYKVDHAFNLLKLNSEGDDVFESLAFSTWISYANKIDQTNSDKEIFAVLKSHYGDKDLERIIAKAKAQEAGDIDEDVMIVLERLQKLQFNQ